MRKIIEELNNTPKRELKDCRITSFRDALLYHGIDIDSFTLCILAKVIGFQYALVKVSKMDDLMIWFAGSNITPFSEELMDNINIKRKRHQFENSKLGFQQITELIDKDIPILSLFDSRLIDGGGSYKQLNIYNPSITLIGGYDNEHSVVYLSLKNMEDTEGLVPVESKLFMDSRCSICEPIAPDNVCYTLEVDDEYREWFKANSNDLIIRALKKTCDSMLKKCESIDVESTSFSAVEYMQGINGMQLLNKRLLEFKDEMSKTQLKKSIVDKIFIIRLLALREGMLQGSNSCFREEFGIGLKRVSKILNKQNLDVIGDEFVEVSYKWRHLLRTLYMAKTYISHKNGFIDNVSKQLDDITKKEEELFVRIRECI